MDVPQVPLTLDRYFEVWRIQMEKFLRTRFKLDNDPLDEIMALVDEKVWRGLEAGRFQHGTSEKSWLLAVANNAAFDWLRREQRYNRRTAVLSDEWVDTQPDTDPSPEEIALTGELVREAIARFNRLPATSRQALLLHVQSGLSCPAIGAMQGIPASRVHNRLKAARRWLGRLALLTDSRAA